MIKANVIMMDGTELKEIMLFTSKNLGDSEIKSRSEVEKALDFENEKIVYFGGKYVQGGLIPKQILEYKIVEDTDDFKERLERFINKNSGIYDVTDMAEFIMYHREDLLNILR